MLNTKDSRSLIEKARDANNGLLLQQVIDLERARLREHGAKEGLDKFKASSIKLLKTAADFAAYKKDCITAFAHFHSGLECINLLAHFNKKVHGIDPDTEILHRMTEGFDDAMATRSQINLGRNIDLILNKLDNGGVGGKHMELERYDSCMTLKVCKPFRHVHSPVQILTDDLEWDSAGDH